MINPTLLALSLKQDKFLLHETMVVFSHFLSSSTAKKIKVLIDSYCTKLNSDFLRASQTGLSHSPMTYLHL